MRRLTFLLALISLLLCICGCGDTVYIEDAYWVMRSAYIVKAEGQMSLLACEEGYPITDADVDASVIDCSLVARGGEFIIMDRTSKTEYTGEYGKGDAYGGTVAYAVFTYNTSGAAVVGKTTYADGGEEYALTLHIGEYLLNFYRK